MRWLALVMLLAGCDQVFGLTPKDAPTRGDVDARVAGDGAPDARFSPCGQEDFGTAPVTGFIGPYDDFSPDDEERFALLTVGTTIMVARRAGAMFPGGNSPVGSFPTNVIRVSLGPEGTRAFTYGDGDTNALRESGAITPPETWGPATDTLIVNALPGRPMAGREHMVVQSSNSFVEYTNEQTDSWTSGRVYTPMNFEHSGNAVISYPSLSPDGLVLVYIADDTSPDLSGVFTRTRASVDDGFSTLDGATGAQILPSLIGDYRSPTLTRGCTHLWVINARTRQLQLRIAP